MGQQGRAKGIAMRAWGFPRQTSSMQVRKPCGSAPPTLGDSSCETDRATSELKGLAGRACKAGHLVQIGRTEQRAKC